MNKDLYRKINEILMDWDPMDVGQPISKFEYQGFVVDIYNAVKQGYDLKYKLAEILNHKLGLDVDPMNTELLLIEEKIEKVINF